MKKFLFTLAAICSISYLYAQTDTLYYNSVWQQTDKANASFYRPPLIPSGEGYLLRDFYISGAKQFEGITLNPESEEYDGTVNWFYENGKIEQTVNYEKGARQGEYNGYDMEGNLLATGFYKDDMPWEGDFSDVEVDFTSIVRYKNGKMFQAEAYDSKHETKARIYGDIDTVNEGNSLIKYYDQFGNLVGTLEMREKEVFNGVYVDYRTNPFVVVSVVQISDGENVSPEKYYYANGSLKKIVYFKNNDPYYSYKEVYYAQDGKLIDSLYLNSGIPQKGTKIDFFEYYEGANIDSIKKIAHYKNGDLNGACIEYFPNGKIGMETNYVKGIIDGDKITYDTLGNKLYTLSYKNGEPWNGTYKEDNSIKTFKDGILTGEQQFYNNGNKSLVMTSEGLVICYDTTGTQIAMLQYKDGEPYEGTKLEIYYDQIQSETVYSKGMVLKEITYYDGKPSNAEEYDEDGNLLKEISYYESGTIQQEIAYTIDGSYNYCAYYDTDGKPLGRLEVDGNENYNGDYFQFENDRVVEHSLYQDGYIVRTWTYTDGKLISDIQNDGVSTFYDIKNNKIYQCNYKDDVPWEGTMFEYDTYTENITEIANYKKGQLEGENIMYEYIEGDYGDDNGTYVPEYIYNYKNGKKEGPSKIYNKGKLVAEVNYANDLANGAYKSYDMEGNLLSSAIYKDNAPYEGVIYDYNYYDDQLSSITNYSNGNKDDEQRYYMDGVLVRVELYDGGTMLKAISYIQGNEYTLTYTNGEPYEGIEYDYYADAVKEYKDGTLVSLKKYADDDFSVLQQLEVFEGETIILTTYFGSNNQKKEEIRYSGYYRNGKAVYYDINGNSIAKGAWEDDEPVSGSYAFYSFYDESSYVLLKVEKGDYFVTEYVDGKTSSTLQYHSTSHVNKYGETRSTDFISALEELFQDYDFTADDYY